MGRKQPVITFNAYPNINESIDNLLPELTSSIGLAIKENNHCAIALAGGNTPRPLYKALSKARLPWKQISITLTDERWVEVDHKDSNENMIKKTLLNEKTVDPVFISLVNNSYSVGAVEAGAIETNKRLTELLPSLDIVVLGMGNDGHFASIFPGISNFNELLSSDIYHKCLAVLPNGKQERISLTYSYLVSAKIIYLLISGKQKKNIIDSIIEFPESHQDYPIWTLLNQALCPVHIYWNA